MLFGAQAFIWTYEWTPEGAAEAGLDFVEIPLLRPESMDVTTTRALLDLLRGKAAEYDLLRD